MAKQAAMPMIAKAYALRDAHLFVIPLKRPLLKPRLRTPFGSSDMSSVWNKGKLVVKTLFHLLKPLSRRVWPSYPITPALPLLAGRMKEH